MTVCCSCNVFGNFITITGINVSKQDSTGKETFKREMERLERWRDQEMERSRDQEMERWRDQEMERWRDGENLKSTYTGYKSGFE